MNPNCFFLLFSLTHVYIYKLSQLNILCCKKSTSDWRRRSKNIFFHILVKLEVKKTAKSQKTVNGEFIRHNSSWYILPPPLSTGPPVLWPPSWQWSHWRDWRGAWGASRALAWTSVDSEPSPPTSPEINIQGWQKKQMQLLPLFQPPYSHSCRTFEIKFWAIFFNLVNFEHFRQLWF